MFVCHLGVHIGQTPREVHIVQTPGEKGLLATSNHYRFSIVEPFESDTFEKLVLEHPLRPIVGGRCVEVRQYDVADVDKPPKESMKCRKSGQCKPNIFFVWIAHDAQSMHKLWHGGLCERIEAGPRRQRCETNSYLAENDGVEEGA